MNNAANALELTSIKALINYTAEINQVELSLVHSMIKYCFPVDLFPDSTQIAH